MTTIIGRWKESGGLIYWAWQEGIAGRDYRETRDAAADAGTLAHRAVEMWIRGGIPTFPPTDIGTKAQTAFEAFLEWADQSNLVVEQTEIRMVSERHRYGGMMDAVLIKGCRAVVDWKTSNALYSDNLIQVAAYAELWNENHPGDPVMDGAHIVRFDKEHGDFRHAFFSGIEEAWRAFALMRELFEIDKRLRKRIK
ncbi:MAG TPA: hypothetical protein VGR84_18785 [Candidatus Acidoferrales bacterium]|nr:hypothetical protein [Candidatus Acidoferrales bacterium]